MPTARSREIGAGESGKDGGPELSVLLLTETVELGLETISHLRGQTAASRIELVLGLPGGELDERHGPDLEAFHSTRVMDWDPGRGTAIARAAGILEASAPVIVLAETHCFPEPNWAEALIEAHRGPWAGVGPELDNENPGPVSWGNMLVDYTTWVAPAPAGPADDIPGHNSSYKRSVLLDEYGDDLPVMMEAEVILHWDLRRRGHRLYIEPRARTQHRNINRPLPAMIEHFYNGRTFGAARSRDWHPLRRVFYALASPLIPLLRTSRTIRALRRKRRRDLRRAYPMMFASFVTHAAGEMTGYLLGGGNSIPLMVKYELERDRWLTDGTGPSEEARAADPARK